MQDNEPTNVDVADPTDEARKDMRGQWVWHAFHENVLSRLGMSFNERKYEIETEKPKQEVARRLRLMRLANLSEEMIERIYQTSIKTGYSASRRTVTYLYVIEGLFDLHEEQCVKAQGEQGCPWTDRKATIFPELTAAEVTVAVGNDWPDDAPELT